MDAPANDNNVRIVEGSGNIFFDLGFEREEADRAVAALREYYAKGGRSFEDFKAELDAQNATTMAEIGKIYQLPTPK